MQWGKPFYGNPRTCFSYLLGQERKDHEFMLWLFWLMPIMGNGEISLSAEGWSADGLTGPVGGEVEGCLI